MEEFLLHIMKLCLSYGFQQHNTMMHVRDASKAYSVWYAGMLHYDDLCAKL